MKKIIATLKKWLKSAINWSKEHLKDRRFRIIFYVVCITLYSEVWIPYLIAFIVGFSNTAIKWLVGVATFMAGLWASPILPFFPIALGLTEAIYEIIISVKKHRSKKRIENGDKKS